MADKDSGLFKIKPPILNSANPWCTTLEQLQELYHSPYTGAVTTRTSLLHQFGHDDQIHQFTFYDPNSNQTSPVSRDGPTEPSKTGSLNTLGYSPQNLDGYLAAISAISDALPKTTGTDVRPDKHETSAKPFIISVTGTVAEVVECYRKICLHRLRVRMPFAMEVNLSCPNIPGKPPPAYSAAALLPYLTELKREIGGQRQQLPSESEKGDLHVHIGIKTPPYTYHDQYQELMDALMESASTSEPKVNGCPVSFITATNTLGSCLLVAQDPVQALSDGCYKPAVNSANGLGIGGLAGAPLHPLALGNVCTIRRMLDEHDELRHIQIIGVGGVEDADGYRRMRAVGAVAVGIGTALGRKGVKVFEEINNALKNGEP